MTIVPSPPPAVPDSGAPSWTAADAAALYRVATWGKGYFDVNDDGHVVVRPDTTPAAEIDLLDVVQGLRQRGLTTPVLLRFSDVLSHRLGHLADAFARAIAEHDYRGRYAAVYPVKVNQQRPVVEEIIEKGRVHRFGLEVGSKPEFLGVMALTGDDPERIVICNGFKDDPYIEAVILATKLGRTIIPVVENFNELQRVIRYAEQYAVRPRIGVRIKLSSHGAGRWQESAGAKSKFGLFTSELLEMVEVLREHDMLDCLQLVHCHTGSQINDIRGLKDAVAELARTYAELARLGAGMRWLDVGGGLGVDYDGTQSSTPSSMNYTLDEYAAEIVYRVAGVCDDNGIEHPEIISESGRAIAAYQSVLVFNVLDVTGLGHFTVPEAEAGMSADEREALEQPVFDLLVAWESVDVGRLVPCYHDALQAREEALNLYNLGYLSLEQRGLAERLYWATCVKIRDRARALPSMPEELAPLEVILGDTYFCNISIFQSLPDSWAIDQLFPIMPIHRLREEPTRRAVLVDITCDSDGRIDRFVGERESQPLLELHPVRAGEPYYLAAFLVGAYQETLGDLHNLFGDTHVVHVRLHEQGGWWIDEIVRGDTASEVLSYVQFDPKRLHPRLARDCEQALRDGRLTLAESRTLLRFYETELNGYTYLAPDSAGEG